MRAVSLLRFVSALSLVAVLATGESTAQRSALREVRNWGLAGGSLAIAVPVGEFANHVNAGGGLDGFIAFNLDPAGASALRLNGSVLAYGRTRDFAYVTSPYYLPIGVTTTSYIVSLVAGPQLTFGQGPVKLYGFGQAGFSYFTTTTSFGNYDCGCSSYDEITEHEDLNLAWEAGGGMLVQLGWQRRVMLDLGARYLRTGRAQYLPAHFVGNGTTAPIETQANLVAIHVGVTVALR